MRLSKLFTTTRKDAPADETAKNAQLLIRAGFVSKEMAGVYNYLPLGKKVLDNIAAIVRDEMNKVGGQEILLSSLQPKELWEKTGRWSDDAVDVWFKTKLQSGVDVGLGFSHEEPLVGLMRNYLTSYQDLPLMIYQVQTKFRNELRAKSGLLRGREFLMKDMYSFARSESEHQHLFGEAKKAYENVFERLGIADKTFFTAADGGAFSDEYSYEFQTLTDSGEDTIYLDRDKAIAINDEIYSDKVIAELGLNKDTLEKVKACEVGNIFNLGTKYSKPLELNFLSEINTSEPTIMGCYGIGISRLMGIVAETLSDDKGLVWPSAIAPAQVYLILLGNSDKTIKAAEDLYNHLTESGISVLYDDRSIVRAGEKFADADLIGIPYRVVVSDKTVEHHKYELKARVDGTEKLVTEAELVATLREK